MRNLIVVVFALIFSQTIFSQGAWVKPKGELYTQIAFNDISNYNRVFNKDGGDLYPSREITDRTLQLYGEYGLTNSLTVTASIPYKLLSTGDLVPQNTNPVTIEEGSYNTFGNVGLGFRYKLANKKYALATQLNVDLPTSGFDQSTGLRSGIDALTVMPTVAIGRGYNKMFFQSYTGLIFRTNDYSNGFKFYIEGGRRFFDQLWVIAFVDIVDSFENGTVKPEVENLETLISLNDSEYGGFGLKLIEEINPNFGITAAVGGAFSAHLEAHRASLNFGLYYKFKKKESKSENK